MPDEQAYKETNRRSTDEWETDDTASPDTKRVLMYGWDSGTSAKIRVAVTATGYLKVTV